MSSEKQATTTEDTAETENNDKKQEIPDEKLMPPPPPKPKKEIEKQEEAKLRAKYPGLKGPGSSDFLQKRLSKGQKYFDSGDYNMAKAKMGGGAAKPPIPQNQKLLLPGSTGDTIPTPDSVPHRKSSIITSKLAAGGGLS